MAETLSAKEIDLSIIVVAYNVKELCDECFRAIRASKDTLTKEILFVDNGSVDGTADYVAEHFPEVTLIRSPTNSGFHPREQPCLQAGQGQVHPDAEL